MRIYMFRSEAQPSLRAFAEDRSGEKLPSQFAPWHATGVITEEKQPPFKFPRGAIESAINDHGYQLWRMKPKAKPA
ncbi:MAG TPA: hypothetical protein VHG27_06880 [Xanthobacteraceae bacterium]|nr:hypothetical protein [Xanthobacteraceae bacterium]